jgi:hypothetical protein
MAVSKFETVSTTFKNGSGQQAGKHGSIETGIYFTNGGILPVVSVTVRIIIALPAVVYVWLRKGPLTILPFRFHEYVKFGLVPQAFAVIVKAESLQNDPE